MFSEQTQSWLVERGLADSGRYRRILHHAGDVTLPSTAELLPYPESVIAVVDGDLRVDGELMVDDMHALVVKGHVTCRSFWIGEGRFVAKTLSVSELCTFACHEGDMQLDVGRVSAAVLHARKSGHAVDTKHTIEGAKLQREKLLEWILEDAFAAVLAALDSGAAIDDAWCLAHQDLVTNVERRELLVHQRVPPRVRKILEDIAAGAALEDAEVGGRPAVRVVRADGSKQVAFLTQEERAALEQARRGR